MRLHFADGVNEIREPIYLKTGMIVSGDGGLTTWLRPTYHGPVFMADSVADFPTVEHLSIDYRELGPLTPEDCAFYAPKAGISWSNLRADSIYVYGAYAAYWDCGGGWMSHLSRFWSKQCRFGFYKIGGTTLHFLNCFAEGTRDEKFDLKGFYLLGVIGSSMTASGMDSYKGESLLHLDQCRGFSISGWDMEGNETFGSNSRLVGIDRCTAADIRCFHGIGNVLNVLPNSNSHFMVIDGGTVSLSAISIGGNKASSKQDDMCRGGGGNARSASIFLKNKPDFFMAQRIIEAPKDDGFIGRRFGLSD